MGQPRTRDLTQHGACAQEAVSQSSQSTTTRAGTDAPAILLPKEAAVRLQITTAMLRRLTERGAIGHVRLGTGQQRVRVGYTEQQLADFIAARTVPPAPIPSSITAATPTPRRRRPSGPATQERSDVTDSLVKAAITSGRITAWGHP